MSLGNDAESKPAAVPAPDDTDMEPPGPMVGLPPGSLAKNKPLSASNGSLRSIPDNDSSATMSADEGPMPAPSGVAMSLAQTTDASSTPAPPATTSQAGVQQQQSEMFDQKTASPHPLSTPGTPASLPPTGSPYSRHSPSLSTAKGLSPVATPGIRPPSRDVMPGGGMKSMSPYPSRSPSSSDGGGQGMGQHPQQMFAQGDKKHQCMKDLIDSTIEKNLELNRSRKFKKNYNSRYPNL